MPSSRQSQLELAKKLAQIQDEVDLLQKEYEIFQMKKELAKVAPPPVEAPPAPVPEAAKAMLEAAPTIKVETAQMIEPVAQAAEVMPNFDGVPWWVTLLLFVA